MLAFTLTVVGALNWGLVGLFDFNLVSALLGGFAGLERVVYILVGASALYVVATHKDHCRACGGKDEAV